MIQVFSTTSSFTVLYSSPASESYKNANKKFSSYLNIHFSMNFPFEFIFQGTIIKNFNQVRSSKIKYQSKNLFLSEIYLKGKKPVMSSRLF